MRLAEYLDYLTNEKKTSVNTIEAYKRDVTAFESFLGKRNKMSLEEGSNTDVVAYLMELKNQGKTKATVNRKLASIRSFYRYLEKLNVITENPTDDIKSPRIERKELEYISIADMEKLLATPNTDSIKGMRDKAMMEVLYATGIRASEMIELRLSDVNLHMGFITCDGTHGKARIVPMGLPARQALENYLLHSRKTLMKDRDTSSQDSIIFVNYIGEQFTRQGFWKVIRQYGKEAGLPETITPQIIRNSFAVHMLQNGADLKSLQELLGHEDIAATQVYLSVTKNRIKDVYDKTHPRAK